MYVKLVHSPGEEDKTWVIEDISTEPVSENCYMKILFCIVLYFYGQSRSVQHNALNANASIQVAISPYNYSRITDHRLCDQLRSIFVTINTLYDTSYCK